MSNDLIAPGIAGAPSKRFENRPIEKESIGSNIGTGLGYNVIAPSGKQFQLRYQGSNYILQKPEGGSADYFDMIILRGGETPSHTWYKQGYKPGSELGPDCSSTDGIGPDDASPDPQSTLCQICEKHEWKVQPSGRKGRECTDNLRLAVFPVSQGYIEKAIGHRINEALLFRIPAASMKALVEYMKNVRERHGTVASYGYVTRVKMRQDVPHAEYTYQVSAWLTDEQVDQMEQIKEEPVSYRILGQSVGGQSLVRQAANQPTQQVHVQHNVQLDVKTAAPEPKVIEGELVVLPKKAETPTMTPVEDAPADMDALVAAMRPRPPQG